MTLVLRAGIGLLLVYALLVLLAWLFQDRLAFPAPRGAPPEPARVGLAGERIELVLSGVGTGGETTLTGWYLPGEGEPGGDGGGARRPALLWFYGNGENIASIWPVLRDFRPRGTALLVLDYPGYGGSGGRTTETGLYQTADLAYAWLRGRAEVDSTRIFVYGRSLGSVPAIYTAATHPVAGLILESPFTSAAAMTRQHYGLFPRLIVRLRLDNLETIRRVRCPLLLFHGTDDRLVPPAMGMQVAAAAVGPSEVALIQGAGHNDTYDRGGETYRKRLAEFVTLRSR
jgi:uncharacterized protein